MINVIEVYNALRDLANKDQKGFISPRVFNEFAGIAQSAVYEEMFKELADAKTLRMRNIDPAQHESVYRGKQDDLHEYIEESTLATTPDFTDGSGAQVAIEDRVLFQYPTDFAKLISLRTVNSRPADEEHALSSNLSGPTPDFPLALISENIEVYGFTSTQASDLKSFLIITYYRQPRSRTFVASSAGAGSGALDKTSMPRLVTSSEGDDGFFIPNPTECRNFDLPEHYKSELIAEMAKMIGVRLRDPIISQYGTAETQTK